MKWSELRKIAEQNGWRFVRHGTKHDIYRHPEKPDTLLIERHQSQEVKNALMNKLKKLVGF
jgi:predicted RNA binding protein YcfA (HicA-like mRNA interferase family)